MASVNKVAVDVDLLQRLYVDEGMSLPAVSIELGITISTARARLKELGLLRCRADAIRIARDQGRLGSGTRGTKRAFTDEWRKNISGARLKQAEVTAKGLSRTRRGYVKYTRGPNKHRAAHVVEMEAQIGRRLLPHEVVHHKDHDKHNNEPSNLMLMTRSEHSRIHGKETASTRKRAPNGQFE